MTKRTESRDAVRAGMRMMVGRLAALAAAACALALTAGAAGGDRVVNELAKLTDPDGQEQDWFGYSVAVDGDVAVVGVPSWIFGTYPEGAALVYRCDGDSWVLEARLEPSDPAYARRFARAVAIDGDTIVVGDYGHDESGKGGAAYVFSYHGSQWIEEAKLLASDGAPADDFGFAVAVDGDVAVIGAPYDDDLGEESGSVYVFSPARGAWEQTAKLRASNGQADYCFGWTVAISGDRFIAGGIQNYGALSTAGYVFRFDGESWTEEAILLPEEVVPDDRYAARVAIDGNVALVSAAGDDDAAHDAGALYVFRHEGSSWIEEAKLLAGDGAEEDRFGKPLVVQGDTVVAGAPGDDDNGDLSGSAYVFTFDGAQWRDHSKLLPSDAVSNAHFGNSVAIADDIVVVGAVWDDDHGECSGSAYVFSASQPDDDCNSNGVPDWFDIANGTSEDCNENAVLDECDLADGTSQDCNGNGIPDECDIADLTSWDCNQNGIPDECDIASGYSEDVNGDGIPDECWFPGEAGLLPLLQKRTLYVRAVDESYEYYEVEEYDEAPDFSPYNNAIEVTAWEGRGAASQHSFVERFDVRASGGVEAGGCSGGGCWCLGMGESTYRITFAAPYEESVLLTGDLQAESESDFSGTFVKMNVAVSEADGVVLFERELICDYESVHADVCQDIELQAQAVYTLSIDAFAMAEDLTCWGDFTIRLTALGDVDGDWDVDTADLLALLGAWGPQEDHPADFDGDGVVNTADLLALLGNWGP